MVKIVQKDYLPVFRLFICIATLKPLQSFEFNLDRLFSTNFTQMLSLNRHEKVKCENCGTQTTKPTLARHRKNCSAATLHCIQFPNFFTKSQKNLNYHIAKKHSAPKPDVIFKCKLCYREFSGFYALHQHRNTQHGPNVGFGESNFVEEDIVGDVDDQSLRKELESCKHFLTDTQMENGIHRVINFARSS